MNLFHHLSQCLVFSTIYLLVTEDSRATLDSRCSDLATWQETGIETHPVPHTVGTTGSWGVKQPARETDHSSPSSGTVLHCMVCTGATLLPLLYRTHEECRYYSHWCTSLNRHNFKNSSDEQCELFVAVHVVKHHFLVWGACVEKSDVWWIHTSCKVSCLWWTSKGKFVPADVMKAQRERWGITPVILNLGAWWRWMVRFMPWLIDSREWALYPWIGGSVCLRVRLDILEKRKTSSLCQELNLVSSSPQPSHYPDCAIPAALCMPVQSRSKLAAYFWSHHVAGRQ